MAFLVEDGTGVQGANALVPTEFVDNYLKDRERFDENSWSSQAGSVKQAAIIKATEYIEKRWERSLRGEKEHYFNAVHATATITFDVAGAPGDTITIAGESFDMNLGSDLNAAAAALAAAIDANTTLNGIILQDAEVDANVVTLTAFVGGDYGNYLTIVDGTGGDVTIVDFAGGLDAGLQETPFPRSFLTDARGNTISGIPFGARAATAEYAVRALSAVLLPDPTIDDSGKVIQEKEERVGPIVEKTVFAEGAILSQVIRPYPAADRLLMPFMAATGGAIR